MLKLINSVPINKYTDSKKIPLEQEQTIVDMYNRGFSMTDIAKKYKVSPDPISRILKKHDVTIRKFYWSGKL